ncbi:hypothetical protein [Shewanella baltica]|uniref:hypothetical protein n=1 Tax=Shewanella baltica TaxID=62322 RepID=UPI003D023BCA
MIVFNLIPLKRVFSIFLVLFYVAWLFFTPYVNAQVEHISLHKRLFELGKLPMLKLNIVVSSDELVNLEFVLAQHNDEEVLLVQQLNPFMLLLLGVVPVTDINAKIIVRHSTQAQWHEFMTVGLFSENDLESKNKQVGNYQVLLTQKPSQQQAITLNTKADTCLLNYTGNETLWRLGIQYAEVWHVNTYVAMLAIYYTNIHAFNQQKINGLRRDAKLYCPPTSLLLKWENNESAKAEFRVMLSIK